jgi:hydrogenase expression/formation protein HypE
MAKASHFGVQCPLPLADDRHITLAHGGGGRQMHQLLDTVFLPAFASVASAARHDGVVFDVGGTPLAFTTDSYVVHPLFFPGGDIGSLAVYGTVNDLAMCGARPVYMSAAFILEEGFAVATLREVVRSMREAAALSGVQVVTGDTKVVDSGKGDGLYINTAGIGVVTAPAPIAPVQVRPGDAILLSGDIGRHGMAIMAVREGLAFESTITSDCAPLAALVQGLIEAGIPLHCLRDLTRGGLATALVEIAEASGTHLKIEHQTIPVQEEVRGACELLGLDPMYVANEGRCVCFVPEAEAERALAVMQAHPLATSACRIGSVTSEPSGRVSLQSSIGVSRIVDMLSGSQLPRIC